jgi:hypothetical protein
MFTARFSFGLSGSTTIASGGIMSATGEYIRMTNYVDDIAATLRRIVVGTSTMNEDERKKLADYMKRVEPNYAVVMHALEGGK